MPTNTLNASIEDLDEQVTVLRARREGLRRELEEARGDLAAARTGRAQGTGSTDALTEAHARSEALAGALREADAEVEAAEGELRDLLRESGQERDRRRLAALIERAEELFAEWADAYRELGAALSSLPRRILDLEAELAALQREFVERADALYPGFAAGEATDANLSGLELGALRGYLEPGKNLARSWNPRDGSSLGRLVRPPERPDLGAVDALAQELLAGARARP